VSSVSAPPAVACTQLLATHPQHLTCTHLRQLATDLCHEWTDVDQPVARHDHCEHPNGEATKVLLVRDVPIDCEEHVELPSGNPQELPILQTGPSYLRISDQRERSFRSNVNTHFGRR